MQHSRNDEFCSSTKTLPPIPSRSLPHSAMMICTADDRCTHYHRNNTTIHDLHCPANGTCNITGICHHHLYALFFHAAAKYAITSTLTTTSSLHRCAPSYPPPPPPLAQHCQVLSHLHTEPVPRTPLWRPPSGSSSSIS